MLLWLWYRAAGVVPIQPLAWELPYAAGEKKNTLKNKNPEFPLWLNRNKPTSIHEDVGSIPGPTQWVKDPALPQAAV